MQRASCAAATASQNAVQSSTLMALRAAGRFRVINATSPWRSIFTVSLAATACSPVRLFSRAVGDYRADRGGAMAAPLRSSPDDGLDRSHPRAVRRLQGA